MTKARKILVKVMSATSDQNIMFDELARLLVSLGFSKRIKGSHCIFFKQKLEEIINIQPNKDQKAKAYQVRQVRGIIIKYKLELPP